MAKRDTSITLQCNWCKAEFHPWANRSDTFYCSRRCRILHVNARRTGTAVAPAALPVRSSESSISQATMPIRPPTPTTAATPSTPSMAEVGDDWREAGRHWIQVADWLAERRAARVRAQAAQSATDNPYRVVALEGKTITIGGYGGSLRVEHDQLVVTDGHSYGDQPSRSETLSRGVHNCTQVVWITDGGAGNISIQALRWLASQNITLTLLTERGEVLGVIYPSPSAPATLGTVQQGSGRPDIRLRRSQYALQPSGRDVVIAHALVERKVAAQQATAEKHPELPDQGRAIEATSLALAWLRHEPVIPSLRTLDGIRVLEGRAARGYFAGWVGLSLRLDAKARQRWPDHWKTIAERNSALTRWQSPRKATNPAQAALNLLYGRLESQIRQSLNAIGADLACGVAHADLQNRDSLVYDAMEGLRASVDDLFLTFLQRHTFGPDDFIAGIDGSVSVHPALCKVLVELCHVEQRTCDVEARWLSTLILDEVHAAPIANTSRSAASRKRR